MIIAYFICYITFSIYMPQGKTGEVQFEHFPSANFELFCMSDISYVAMGPAKPPKLANNTWNLFFLQMALTLIII